jgi:hypothetical protein
LNCITPCKIHKISSDKYKWNGAIWYANAHVRMEHSYICKFSVTTGYKNLHMRTDRAFLLLYGFWFYLFYRYDHATVPAIRHWLLTTVPCVQTVRNQTYINAVQ